MLAVTSTAFAYRLICIPVAEVLPEGVYKVEASAIHNDHKTGAWLPSYRFDSTIFKDVEIGIKAGGLPGHFSTSNTQVNLQWQIAKETKDEPGYGIGVWNLYDSDDHRAVKASYFAGAYKTVSVSGLKYPVKAHLLVGTDQLSGVFGGVSIPLSKRFSVAAEYTPTGVAGEKSLMAPGTTSNLSISMGYNQTPHMRFKIADAGGDIGYGITYTNTLK